jgi:nitrilase
MIVAPDQTIVAELPPGGEGIIAHDIDLRAVREARHNFDPAGHYARPDIFSLKISRNRAGGTNE